VLVFRGKLMVVHCSEMANLCRSIGVNGASGSPLRARGGVGVLVRGFGEVLKSGVRGRPGLLGLTFEFLVVEETLGTLSDEPL
jgi:hypothetical protein